MIFLDEVLEFRRNVLESIATPLREGEITIHTGKAKSTFPACPIVIAGMNPCPCGYKGAETSATKCTCQKDRLARHMARATGPLFDTLDLQVVLPSVSVRDLQTTPRGESSATVRARVTSARAMQASRKAAGLVDADCNAKMSARDIERAVTPDTEGLRILSKAVELFGLNGFQYGKILRIARTIADLEGSEAVRTPHLAEAVQLRSLDRQNAASREAV